MSVQLRNFLLRERGRENKRNELRGVIQRRLTRILFFFFQIALGIDRKGSSYFSPSREYRETERENRQEGGKRSTMSRGRP